MPTLHRQLYHLPREGVEPSYKTMRFFCFFSLFLSPLLAYYFGIFSLSLFTADTSGVFFCIFFFHMIYNNAIYMHIVIFTKPPRIKHAYKQALQISLHGNIIQVTETSALMHARERERHVNVL